MIFRVKKVIDNYTYLVENHDTILIVYRKDITNENLTRPLFTGEQLRLDLYAVKDRNGKESFIPRNIEVVDA